MFRIFALAIGFLLLGNFFIANVAQATTTRTCCVCIPEDPGTRRICGNSPERESGDLDALRAERERCNELGRNPRFSCRLVTGHDSCSDLRACRGDGARIGSFFGEEETPPETTPETPREEPEPEIQFEQAKPTLQIPIPGFGSFSDIEVEGEEGGRYIDVPFLAQYISAIYQYALGIIVTLASVMVVIGGFKWILARGDAGKIGDAKETITRAVMGLALALGTYTILYIVNPELVALKALRVNIIARISVEREMMTTRRNTSGGGAYGFRSCQEGATVDSSSCPYTLIREADCSNPRTEERSLEFEEQMSFVALEGGARERVKQVAQAAVACGVHLGSCNRTYHTILEIAHASASQNRGRTVNSTPLFAAQQVARDCLSAGGTSRDCKRQAKDSAFNAARAEFGTDYPDVWADELQPGDVFWVYNARSGGAGQHSAIFIGWAREGVANVVHGSYSHFVSEGTICIKESCGGVLTRVFHTD